MRNLRLDQTGQRLTRYGCHLVFYDFTKIQGPFLGLLSKACGFSNITHVGPVIDVPWVGKVAITICQSKTRDGRIVPQFKMHKEDVLIKLGAREIHRIDMGLVPLELNNVIKYAESYTDSRPWDLIFYNFIGRFIGLTRPRACTSFVCSLFNIKDCWHPATLYRRLRK